MICYWQLKIRVGFAGKYAGMIGFRLKLYTKFPPNNSMPKTNIEITHQVRPQNTTPPFVHTRMRSCNQEYPVTRMEAVIFLALHVESPSKMNLCIRPAVVASKAPDWLQATIG